MDFNIGALVSDIIASGILLVRRTTKLVFHPYAEMRLIAKDVDAYQFGLIFLIVYAYFVYGSVIRQHTLNPLLVSSSGFVAFGFFVLTFFLSVGFFYVIGNILEHMKRAQSAPFTSYLMLFAYSLFPTWIWFVMTSTLFYLFPPPRYVTPLGKLFSIIFVIASVTLLLWRIVLWYVSLRFAYRATFFTIVTVMIMFGLWFVPYTIMMYRFGIFRIPFI